MKGVIEKVANFNTPMLEVSEGEASGFSAREMQSLGADRLAAQNNSTERRCILQNHDRYRQNNLINQMRTDQQHPSMKANKVVPQFNENLAAHPLQNSNSTPVLVRQEPLLHSRENLLHPQEHQFLDHRESPQVAQIMRGDESMRGDERPDNFIGTEKKSFGERIQQFFTPKTLCIVGGVGLLAFSLLGTIATGGLLAGVMAAATLACYGAIGVGGFKIAKKMFNSYFSPEQSDHLNEPMSDWEMNKERLLQDAYNQGYNKSQVENEAAYNQTMYQKPQEQYAPSDTKSVSFASSENDINDRLRERRKANLEQTNKDDEVRRLNEQHLNQIYQS